jgi:hypothetical protein
MIKPTQTANSTTNASVMKLAPLIKAAKPKQTTAQVAISCRAAIATISYDPLDANVN